MPNGLLKTQDPAAQALIAGKGLKVETEPTERLKVPTPEIFAPAAAGAPPESAVQPGKLPETSEAEAMEPPLPAAPPEVTPEAAPEVPRKEAPKDEELDAIKDFALEDIVDADTLEALKAQAFPVKDFRKVRTWLEAISTGVMRGMAEYEKPGAAMEMEKVEQTKQMEAVRTLADLTKQVGLYKREALRQRLSEKRTEAQQNAILERTMFQAAAKAVAERAEQANKIGVVGPAPPTVDTILKDPESTQVWLNQMDLLIADKRNRTEIVTQQVPIFAKMAKDGADPDSIRISFLNMLRANGMSETDVQRFWASTADALHGEASNTRRKTGAWLEERAARTANLRNMVKNRDENLVRLREAMQSGNAQKAAINLRSLERLSNDITTDLASLEIKAAVVQQLESSGQLPPGAASQLASDIANLRALSSQVSTQIQDGWTASQMYLNSQRPEITLRDSIQTPLQKLFTLKPDAQAAYQVGGPEGLKQWVSKHVGETDVITFFNDVAAEVIKSPDGGQNIWDYLDRMKIQNTPPSALAPRKETNAGQPTAKP